MKSPKVLHILALVVVLAALVIPVAAHAQDGDGTSSASETNAVDTSSAGTFNQALAGAAIFIPIVLGLVEASRRFGATGNVLFFISLVLGLGFGMWYWIAAIAVPATPMGWLLMTLFGAAIGLTTSGLNDYVSARFPRVTPQ
jgi:hypothetical protein